MKAITFLGAVTAHVTEYVLPDGRSHEAPFFGAALARFIPDLEMRVFVTEKARAKHLADFLPLVEDNVREVMPVDIPDGGTTGQLWEIFDAVVEHVTDGEDVVFDITHSFRSLPFLAFLAAAYLREVKHANLRAVYYGNWEARDQSVTPPRTPVIELSEFVQLLDWMTAANHFARTGDSVDFAGLIERVKPDYRTATVGEINAWRDARIDGAIGQLQRLSLALQLIRPNDALKESAGLTERLAASSDVLARYPKPFSPLVNQVVDAYRPLAMGSPESDPVRALETERNLVQWYIDRQQYVQAVAVAREWIVTWVMLHAGSADIYSRDAREAYSRAITAISPRKGTPESAVVDVSHVTQIQDVAKIFMRLAETRNDLLHAGKSKGAKSAATIKRAVREHCARLYELPIEADTPTP